MRCEDARVHIHEREDGELDRALAPALEAHVAACAGCAAAAAGLRRVRAALRAIPAAPAPADLRPAVLREIGSARVPGRVLSWPRIAIPVGAAAALFVGAVTISAVRRVPDAQLARAASPVAARTGTGFSADAALDAFDRAEMAKARAAEGVAETALSGRARDAREEEDDAARTRGPAKSPGRPADPPVAAAPTLPAAAPAPEAVRPGEPASPAGPATPGGPEDPADGGYRSRTRGAHAAPKPAEGGWDEPSSAAPQVPAGRVTRVAVFRTEDDARRFLATAALRSGPAFGGPSATSGARAPVARETGDSGAGGPGSDVVRGAGGGGGGGTTRGEGGSGPDTGGAGAPAGGTGGSTPAVSAGSESSRPSGPGGGGAPSKSDAPTAPLPGKPGSPPGAPAAGARAAPTAGGLPPGSSADGKKADAGARSADAAPLLVAGTADVPESTWQALVAASNGGCVEVLGTGAIRGVGGARTPDAAAARRLLDLVASRRDARKQTGGARDLSSGLPAGGAPPSPGASSKDAKADGGDRPKRAAEPPASAAPPAKIPSAPVPLEPDGGATGDEAESLILVVIDPAFAAPAGPGTPGAR